MNIWECQYPKCHHTANGTGGAIGLRAIGWYWKQKRELYESILLCPAHWPENEIKPIPDHCLYQRVQMCNMKEKCSYCTAGQEAERIQVEYLGASPTHKWKPIPHNDMRHFND